MPPPGVLKLFPKPAGALMTPRASVTPHLPWRAIMGSGNVYRHDYDDVAEQLVWQTVQNSLRLLIDAVNMELNGGDDAK